MFKDPSGLVSENEMGGNNVQTISGIDRIVSTFEEIFKCIVSIFGSGGGGDDGFHSPEARAERIRAHDEIRARGEHKEEKAVNGRTMVRGGAAGKAADAVVFIPPPLTQPPFQLLKQAMAMQK